MKVMKTCDKCGSKIQEFKIYDLYGNTVASFSGYFEASLSDGSCEIRLKSKEKLSEQTRELINVLLKYSLEMKHITKKEIKNLLSKIYE